MSFFFTDDILHSLKKSAFCLRTSYFMNKYGPPSPPPGDNFASGAVWHTIVFKVPAFRGGFPFLGPKLVENHKLNPNNHCH